MPTREGWGALALTGFFFLLATNLMAGWLFLLVAFMLSLVIASALTARRAVTALDVDVLGPPPAVEGEEIRVRLAVRARRGVRFVRLDLTLGDAAGGSRRRSLTGRAAGGIFFSALRAGERVETEVIVAPLPRGVHAVSAVGVTSAGLVGMFRLRRTHPAAVAVTVRPRYRLLPRVPEPATVGGGLAAPRPRREGEFAGLREYLPGDPARRIHWRSSARRGQVVVLELEEPRAPRLVLIVDTDPAQKLEQLDAACRAAASILHTAERAGWEVSLVAPDADGRPAVIGGWERAWDALARLRPDDRPTGAPLAAAVPALAGVGAVAVTFRRSGNAPNDVVLVGPADAVTPWRYDREGNVWCAS